MNVVFWVLAQGGGSGSGPKESSSTVSLADVPERLAQRAGTFYERYGGMIEQWLAKIGLAVLILIVGWVVSGWLRGLVRRGGDRTRMDITVSKFVSNIVRWTILVLAVVTALDQVGVGTASFSAVIAATGLAIGLAFQNSLSNLAAGVMLLVFRPFKVGDTIKAAGITGTVNEVDLFSTEIDTPDGRRIVVPNGPIASGAIENLSHHPRRRADVTVQVAIGTDVEKTRAALVAAAQASGNVLKDPKPEIGIADMTPRTITWSVGVWALQADLGLAKQNLIQKIKEAFDREGIRMARP